MTRRRWIWILGIGALVAIAAGVTVPRLISSNESTPTATSGQTTYTVTRGDLRQTLVVYGEVAPKQEYTFTFDGDRVDEILVDVGQRVEQGQVLVELDRTQLELALIQAERSLKEAEAEGVPLTIREKELLYEIALENYDDATLRAPFAGVVTTINQATTSSESWRIVLIDTSELYVETTVDQLDAPDIAVGLTADAMIEPLPDRTWPVEIVEVGGMAVASYNSTTVAVTGRLPEADSSILVGYSVEMEIVISSATDVLRVPIAGIREAPRGWMVMKLVDGEPTPHEVTIGVTTDDYAEVTDGLEEGDIIVLQSATAPTDGARAETREMFMQGGGMDGGGPPSGGFPGMP
jgi:macrolide-specific efflux system membrane fusion protein